jgi:hypothetical protein
VSYIDDILIMVKMRDQAIDCNLSLIYLLDNLGYIVHPGKTVMTPSQEIAFLGMEIHSQTMDLQLSRPKIKKVRSEMSSLLASKDTLMAIAVSLLFGKLNSVSQAIPFGPLCSIET